MAVQVHGRRRAIEIEATALAALQSQRHQGFLVDRANGDGAILGADDHTVVDDRRSSVVIVRVADAATHGGAAVLHVGVLELAQRQVARAVDCRHIGGCRYINTGPERARASAFIITLICAVVQAVQRHGPVGTGNRLGGKLGICGDVRAGTVL